MNVPATAVAPLPNPPPFDTKGASVIVWIGPDLAGTTAPTTTPATTAPGRSSTTAPGHSTTTTGHSSTSTTKKP
jgi:hypothetical protein